MSGCFGNSREDRSRERELNRYLDSLACEDLSEEDRLEREALEEKHARKREADDVSWENKWRGER